MIKSKNNTKNCILSRQTSITSEIIVRHEKSLYNKKHGKSFKAKCGIYIEDIEYHKEREST